MCHCDYSTVIRFCLTTAPQVVDQADTTEAEPRSTLDDLETDKTEVLHDEQSRRSLDPREEVVPTKHVPVCAADFITYPT